NGQVNLIVLALCVAALQAYTNRMPARGALAWATAVAIKIVPAILSLFFARRGRWSLTIGALIVAAVLCLLPVATMGADVFSVTPLYVTSFIAGSFNGSRGTDPLDFSAGAMLV